MASGKLKLNSVDWGVKGWSFLFAVALVFGGCSHAQSGQKDGICEFQGGKFPKFSLEGHPPRKASKGAIDLTLCKYYRKKTCCDVVQTHSALLSLQRLATTGEASKECLEKWEVLECSICDPRVGVTRGPPLLCPSLCESVFSACFGAFFSTEPLSQVLMPCGPKDVLCAEAHEWASNSSKFCELSGFSVMDSSLNVHSLKERDCFDGKAESPSISMGDVDNSQRSQRRDQHYNTLDMLKDWTKNMNIAVQIMWAIGGLVLTAGAWHFRQKNLVKRNAAATVLRNKLLQEEARARQQALYKGSSPRTRSETRHSTKTG
ncbi:unnamed protein product [Calypogeia fissa]